MKVIPRDLKVHVLLVPRSLQIQRAVHPNRRRSIVLIGIVRSNRSLADGPGNDVRIQGTEAIGEKQLLLVQIKDDLRRRPAFSVLPPRVRIGEQEDFVRVLRVRLDILHRLTAERKIGGGQLGRRPEPIEIAPTAPNLSLDVGRSRELEEFKDLQRGLLLKK